VTARAWKFLFEGIASVGAALILARALGIVSDGTMLGDILANSAAYSLSVLIIALATFVYLDFVRAISGASRAAHLRVSLLLALGAIVLAWKSYGFGHLLDTASVLFISFYFSLLLFRFCSKSYQTSLHSYSDAEREDARRLARPVLEDATSLEEAETALGYAGLEIAGTVGGVVSVILAYLAVCILLPLAWLVALRVGLGTPWLPALMGSTLALLLSLGLPVAAFVLGSSRSDRVSLEEKVKFNSGLWE
jgi:hypothetical protein